MPDRSTWRITVREWFPGRYRAVGIHESGKQVSPWGLDPERSTARREGRRRERPAFVCPVCEYDGLTAKPYEIWPPPPGVVLLPPYADVLGSPSYEICPSCGFEFGNDDDPGTGAEPSSFESYRDEWVRGGRKWFYAPTQPPNGVPRSGVPPQQITARPNPPADS